MRSPVRTLAALALSAPPIRRKVDAFVHDREIPRVVHHALIGRVLGEYAHPEVDIALQLRWLRERFVGLRRAQAEQ